ncbi:MAG: GreA/GreB family elongation factor [bacterium]|nr:GreA/GreB family elongation factor [bacterium]
MSSDRKTWFVEELKKHYQQAIASAREAEVNAAGAADEVRKQARNKDDAKAAVEPGRMAGGHRKRRQRAARELDSLIQFASGGVPRFGRNSKVALGALIDVSIEGEEGSEERTLFLLPVGAGTELMGPGGDGFISVIGPQSPVGQALLGASVGDEVEVMVAGRDREWTVVDLA